MKLTPVQLAKRVEKWRDLLPYTGIGSMRICCVTITDEIPGSPGAIAGVQPAESYDTVHFYFQNDFLGEIRESDDEYRLDEVIVHEWMHVIMRDHDEALAVIEGWMSPHAYDDFIDRIKHEREKLVDRMARQIVALHYGRTKVH